MKLTVLQKDLAKALSTASRFVNPRAQLPILSNIVLRSTKSRLYVLATNLEMSYATSIGAKVDEEGDIAVPAKNTSDLISNISEESISLNSEKEKLNIKTPSFNADVAGMNTSDFPDIPDEVQKAKLSFNGEILKKALGKVAFATSLDETRPILTGVLFVVDGKNLSLVATDGFRLSQKKLKLDSEEKEGKYVIPKSVLTELQRVGESGDIRILPKSGDNQVLFGIGKTVLTSGILSGEFPNFERIIPEAPKVFVEVDKQEFARSVKLAAVFAREAANVVKLSIGKSSLVIETESAKVGSQKKEIDAKVEGNEMDIAYNYRYLEEFLANAEGETVIIELTDASTAAVFKDKEDKDFLHLIMPVRMQG